MSGSKQFKRSVFFVSDGTAITAETLGHSLLAQFPNVDFDIPFFRRTKKTNTRWKNNSDLVMLVMCIFVSRKKGKSNDSVREHFKRNVPYIRVHNCTLV